MPRQPQEHLELDRKALGMGPPVCEGEPSRRHRRMAASPHAGLALGSRVPEEQDAPLKELSQEQDT